MCVCIGLNNLHSLTSSKKYELRVELEDFDGKTSFANYSSFSVGDEFSGFQLNVGGFTDGGAGQWPHSVSGWRTSECTRLQNVVDTVTKISLNIP